MTPTKAFAAYHPEYDWIPMSGIGRSEKYCHDWIRENYVGGRDKWRVVPVLIRVQKPRKKRKLRKLRAVA